MMLISIEEKHKKVSLILLIINHHLIVGATIESSVPDSKVIFNLVPKEHAMADIYCQLIPNDDDN